MLHQKMDAEARQKAIQKAMGSDPKEFDKKISWLKNRWQNQDDTGEARLMGYVLSVTAPFYTAIISDNLKFFQDAYKNIEDSDQDANRFLKIACLCGSQKVAEFLLKELKLSYSLPECNYILDYVTASNNIEWIKEVATIMVKTGMKMPSSIYVHADYTTIDIVKKIFKENKPKTDNIISIAQSTSKAERNSPK